MIENIERNWKYLKLMGKELKMIQKHYLDNEDTMMIEEHKRMYPTKDKSVIKFKKK